MVSVPLLSAWTRIKAGNNMHVLFEIQPVVVDSFAPGGSKAVWTSQDIVKGY